MDEIRIAVGIEKYDVPVMSRKDRIRFYKKTS